MKSVDIVKTLMAYMPRHTDKFSQVFNPDAVSVSGTTVTVTKTAHGLVDESLISVTNGEIVNPIVSIDDSGDDVVFTTTNNHDFVGGDWLDEGLPESRANLTSVTDSSIDGDYQITAVPNRKTFAVASFPNTGLTDVILNENKSVGVDGLYNITLIDDDSFIFEIEYDLGSISVNPSTMEIHNRIRISAAVDYNRAKASYERMPSGYMWGFVVLGDNDINKDRNVNSDAEMEQGNLNEWNGMLLSPFSFYVFVPTFDSISGREARDEIEEARPALFRSLLNAVFDTGFEFDAISGVTPVGDGIQEYKKAFYTHRFQFRQVAQISSEDTLYTPKTSAFRDVTFDYENILTDNGEVLATADVDLDEEPI